MTKKMPVKKNFKQKVAAAKKKASAELTVLKKKFSAAEKKAKSYVKNNPEKTALIAAAIGAAVGAALTAAIKKKR